MRGRRSRPRCEGRRRGTGKIEGVDSVIRIYYVRKYFSIKGKNKKRNK